MKKQAGSGYWWRSRKEKKTGKASLTRGRLLRGLQALEPRLALSGAEFLPYLGWNYVSFTAGELPETTSWVEQEAVQSSGLGELEVVAAESPGGEGVLRAQADLFRTAEDHRDGEIFVDLRYRLAHPVEDGTREQTCGAMVRDLQDAKITIDIKVDDSLHGASSAPNGVQIFLKSMDDSGGTENWYNYYGEWHNMESDWQQIVLDLSQSPVPAYMDAEFDASEVGLVGIKLGTNESDTGTFTGQVDVANVNIEYADQTVSVYDFENTENSIERMAATGANTVALVDHWFVERRTAAAPGEPLDIFPEIQWDPEVTQQHPESTTAVIEETIAAIHEEGLSVHLKPHLDLKGFAYDEGNDEWRGMIKPTEGDTAAFFESYTEFIGFYADIAERTGAEALIIETELVSLDTDDAFRDEWEAVIQSVRETYNGTLVVAPNWDAYQDHTFTDLVDAVGIDAYFPLTDAANPTKEELAAAWQDCQVEGDLKGKDWVSEITTWASSLDKPFYFTEIGIQSRTGAAAEPGGVCQDGDTAFYNGELQVAYYEAALDIFADVEGFAGLLGWDWASWSDAGGIGNIDFTPQNKELEAEAPRLFLPVTLIDGELYVKGTYADDVFDLEEENGSINVTYNGEVEQFSKSEVTSVRIVGRSGDDTIGYAVSGLPLVIDGDLGDDAVTVTGTEGDETVTLRTDQIDVSENGASWTGTFANVSSVEAVGGGGTDTARLFDSEGDDFYESAPGLSTLEGDGFVLAARDFMASHAYSTAGGTDTAEIDGPEKTKVKFKTNTNEGWSKLRSSQFVSRTRYFASVKARSDNRSSYALFYDSAGNDSFVSQENRSWIVTSQYNVVAAGFSQVSACSRAGGYDKATLFDTPGDDEVRFRLAKTQLYDAETKGSLHRFVVRAFDEVHARATEGGFDKAKLHDTLRTDLFEASDDLACMSRQKLSPDLLYDAVGFDFVKAYCTAGTDEAEVDEPLDFELYLDGDWQ